MHGTMAVPRQMHKCTTLELRARLDGKTFIGFHHFRKGTTEVVQTGINSICPLFMRQ